MKRIEGQIYIYALVDPTDDTIRYIGQSTASRRFSTSRPPRRTRPMPDALTLPLARALLACGDRKRRCDHCGGSGIIRTVHAWSGKVECESCHGRGWMPKRPSRARIDEAAAVVANAEENESL
jgi:hypothetical protein